MLRRLFLPIFSLTLAQQISWGQSVVDPAEKEEVSPRSNDKTIERKWKKRQNYNSVKHVEQAQFNHGELLNKTFSLRLPKSELPFELLAVTQIKNGVNRAQYNVLQKTLKADRRKNGIRPQGLLKPFLTNIKIQFTVNGNSKHDRIGLVAYYDNEFSSNPTYRKSQQSIQFEIPSRDQLLKQVDEEKVNYYLNRFDGTNEIVRSYLNGLKMLKEFPHIYYNISSVKEGSDILQRNDSITKKVIYGWNVKENIGKVEINVPYPQHFIGFTLYGHTLLSEEDRKLINYEGVAYLEGTNISYSIDKIQYEMSIPGLQGSSNSKFNSIKYDANKKIELPYSIKMPKEKENYIAHEKFSDMPFGFVPIDFELQNEMENLMDSIIVQKNAIISELEHEKNIYEALESRYEAVAIRAEKTRNTPLSFEPDVDNPLFKGTALVLDLSGSMKGESATELKKAAKKALFNLPRDTNFAIVYENKAGSVVYNSFLDDLSWENNLIHMEKMIDNVGIGDGSSNILNAILALHDEDMYPQSAGISNIYVVTDGSLSDYGKFNEGMKSLQGTSKEINILQIGHIFNQTISNEVQNFAKKIKDLEKKIAILNISSEQIREALNEMNQEDDFVELINADKEVVRYTIEEAELIMKQNHQSLESLYFSLDSLRDKYNSAMEGLLDKTEDIFLPKNKAGKSNLLNSLADLSGGSRQTVGQLSETEKERKRRELSHRHHQNKLQAIQSELEERGLANFDDEYTMKLDEQISLLKEELKDEKKATKIFDGTNKKLRRQIRELKKMEKELKGMKQEWEQNLMNKGYSREQINYIKRVHLSQYEWLEDVKSN